MRGSLLSGVCLIAVALAGCASQQLNENTLDIAANVDALYTRQVLANLSKFVDDPYAFPSSVNFSAGQIMTANSVTPSLTFPLTSTVTSGANLAAATLTRSVTQASAGSGAGLTANNTQTQNYTVAPQSDADTLRNYQVLYRHAVYGDKVLGSYRIPNILLSGVFLPDPYFLQLPHCVVCASLARQGRFISDLASYAPQLNPDLQAAAWVYWRNDPDAVAVERLPLEAAVDLGHFGHHELYMTKRDYDGGVLSKFVFFFLPNSQPLETFNQKADITPPPPAPPGRGPKVALPPGAQSAPGSGQNQPPAQAPYIVIPASPATNQRFTPSSQQPNFPLVISPN